MCSPALITLAVVQPEEVIQALAAALLPLLVAEVVGIGEDPEEPDEAVQLAHPVLEGGPTEGPLVAAVQGKDGLGSAAPPVLDAVGLIQDDAPPGHLCVTSHARAIHRCHRYCFYLRHFHCYSSQYTSWLLVMLLVLILVFSVTTSIVMAVVSTVVSIML